MTTGEFNVRALYDFTAESEHELSFQAQEILTITSQSGGAGWWHAKNSAGQFGAIPENYVQPIDDTSNAPLSSDPNTNNNYSEFDGFNTNEHNTQPLTGQNQHSWSLSEPALPPSQPNQTNEHHIDSSLNLTSPPTTDENLFDTSSATLDPYATGVVDVSPTLESVPASFLNPFAAPNAMNASQDTWYSPIPRTPEPVLQQTPQQLFDISSPFEFPQAPIPQSTPYDDFVMPSQAQLGGNIYDTASPFISQTDSTPVTQSMPIVPTQSIDKNNSSTPPKLTASLTTNNTATSPTNKKVKDKKKFMTLGRSKSKPEEKIRRISAEANEELSPQSTNKESGSDSFSDPDSANQSSSLNKQAGGGDAKAPPKARFFDKHGVDNYILNGCKAKADEDVKIEYDEKEGGVHWPNNPNLPPFTCKIEEPSKGTKLGGLKAYMEYKIHAQTPGGRVVNRRYKHFDWLHEQLVNKFRFICVPHLPGKQIAGRFETEFIEGRRRQLEIWLNRICHHPVLCASFIVQHFITCELTEKNNKDWKTGKRRAEKDELREASWLHCVTLTNTNLNETQIAQQIETFAQQQPGLETHLKNLSQGLSKYLERHTEVYERDIQRVGELFSKVHTAIQVDTTTPGNPELSNSIAKISTSYNAIAELYKTKASEGIRDLNERLQEYIGLLACFPTVLSIQRSAAEFTRNVQQRGPAITPDFNGATHRGHVLNHVVLAEINFFQREKVNDFNLYMKTFMDAQTQFYETVTTELRDASSTFN